MGDDTLKKKFEKDTRPTFCPICTGTLEYTGLGEYTCAQCGAKILDDYGKVRKFLDANGPSPAVVISEGTGVPVPKINQFLREGRVEIPDGSGVYIRCENCGTEIRFGRYCSACAAKLAKSIQGIMMDAGDKPTRHGDGASMHFLGKDKKGY